MSAGRKPRRGGYQDTKFRPIRSTATAVPIADDTALRQADAAAWSAISGLPMQMYRGIFTYIPLPPDLQAQMRQAAEELTAMPGPERAEKLLRLAHIAAYGPNAAPPTFAPMPLEPPRKPVQADGAAEWWETAGEDRKAASDALTRFAEEAHAALAASEWEAADGGEAPREPAATAREWWE